MKVLMTVGLVALTAMPAVAFERMARSDCRAAIEQFSALMDDAPAKTERLVEATRVTPQGWCEIRSDGLDGAEFENLEWRAEGITRWTRDGIPPLALEFRVTGIDQGDLQNNPRASRPPVDLFMTLRQVPDAGQVIVERAVLENNAGDSISVSGVFERLYLSSPSMMQVSLGSATFKAGLMSMTLEGTIEDPFGFEMSVEVDGAPQSQRDLAFDMISRLPVGLISDESRAELTAFAGDLPKPVGTLEVNVNSERGLGIMQVGAAIAMSGLEILTEEKGADQMEVLFDGLTIGADWTPAAQVAD